VEYADALNTILARRALRHPVSGPVRRERSGGYGLSIVFDVLALRYLGAAREAAFFATAPFIGAVAAIPILGDSFGWRESCASVLMVVGLVVMVAGYRGSESPTT